MRKNELKPCYGTTIAMYKKWNWNKFLFDFFVKKSLILVIFSINNL